MHGKTWYPVGGREDDGGKTDENLKDLYKVIAFCDASNSLS